MTLHVDRRGGGGGATARGDHRQLRAVPRSDPTSTRRSARRETRIRLYPRVPRTARGMTRRERCSHSILAAAGARSTLASSSSGASRFRISPRSSVRRRHGVRGQVGDGERGALSLATVRRPRIPRVFFVFVPPVSGERVGRWHGERRTRSASEALLRLLASRLARSRTTVYPPPISGDICAPPHRSWTSRLRSARSYGSGTANGTTRSDVSRATAARGARASGAEGQQSVDPSRGRTRGGRERTFPRARARTPCARLARPRPPPRRGRA